MLTHVATLCRVLLQKKSKSRILQLDAAKSRLEQQVADLDLRLQLATVRARQGPHSRPLRR